LFAIDERSRKIITIKIFKKRDKYEKEFEISKNILDRVIEHN